jgi:hypothetical protein
MLPSVTQTTSASRIIRISGLITFTFRERGLHRLRVLTDLLTNIAPFLVHLEFPDPINHGLDAVSADPK